MDARTCRAVTSVIALSAVLFASSSHGQGITPWELQALQSQLAQQKQLAAAWESQARIEFSLVMLVAVLGAIVALLQKVEGKKWCSLSVAFLGVVISIVTVASREYFDADHKTYKRSAEIARREISTVETALAVLVNPDIDPDSRNRFLMQVSKGLSTIDSLAERVGGAPPFAPSPNSSRTTFNGLTGVAYAQPSSRPLWVSQTRAESATSYRFVGTSSAGSAAAAQSQSLQKAQSAAAAALSIPLDRVRQYSSVRDTYLEYNGNQRMYVSYTMIELNKAFARRQ